MDVLGLSTRTKGPLTPCSTSHPSPRPHPIGRLWGTRDDTTRVQVDLVATTVPLPLISPLLPRPWLHPLLVQAGASSSCAN
jgi:hypothetical protein